MKRTGAFIVKSHHPRRRQVILAVGGLGLLVAGWLLFNYGQYKSGFNSLEALNVQRGLKDQIDTLEQEKQRFREQVAILESSQQVDQQAYREVRENLKQLQEEILELREEVDFYRGIVSPSERIAGLNIQTFKLLPAGEEGWYHYELVLTQVLKNDKMVYGIVKLKLQGAESGEPAEYRFKEISNNKSVSDDFRFRYFQKLEGDIQLPREFAPRTVEVEMLPRGRKRISRSFPWVVEGA